jgi:hypothetical protein
MSSKPVRVPMSRVRLLFVFVLIAGCAAVSHMALARTVRDYTGGVTLVTEGGPPGGPCLSIRGRVTAPDFFAGLKRRETARGIEFRRGGNAVESFPEELSVRIWIREFPCHVGLTEVSPLLATPEGMSSLQFKAYWKRGMEMRSVDGLALRTFYRRKEQPTTLVGAPVTIQRDTWVYNLTVSSQGVPLTDHLILEIFTKDGLRWARVSAQL